MCIFCSIDRKKIILETARSFLIVDKCPLGEMSFSCVSKTHVSSITELSLGEGTDLSSLAIDSVRIIKKIFNPAGLKIFIDEGEVAGQKIDHLRIHIVILKVDYFQNLEGAGEIEALTNEEVADIKQQFLKRGL